jgi:hypothetical protein
MRFSAEIWRRSEHTQALGNFSKLIGEKSPIRRQRVKMFCILQFGSHLRFFQYLVYLTHIASNATTRVLLSS